MKNTEFRFLCEDVQAINADIYATSGFGERADVWSPPACLAELLQHVLGGEAVRSPYPEARPLNADELHGRYMRLLKQASERLDVKDRLCALVIHMIGDADSIICENYLGGEDEDEDEDEDVRGAD